MQVRLLSCVLVGWIIKSIKIINCMSEWFRGRTLRCQRKGWGSIPHSGLCYVAVAQQVERLFEKQEVRRFKPDL